MEAAAGLEPAKTGFADQRLDHFGIAASDLYSGYRLYFTNMLQAAVDAFFSARCSFTTGAPIRLPHSVQEPS